MKGWVKESCIASAINNLEKIESEIPAVSPIINELSKIKKEVKPSHNARQLTQGLVTR